MLAPLNTQFQFVSQEQFSEGFEKTKEVVKSFLSNPCEFKFTEIDVEHLNGGFKLLDAFADFAKVIAIINYLLEFIMSC